jgi:hypothetical protein
MVVSRKKNRRFSFTRQKEQALIDYKEDFIIPFVCFLVYVTIGVTIGTLLHFFV